MIEAIRLATTSLLVLGTLSLSACAGPNRTPEIEECKSLLTTELQTAIDATDVSFGDIKFIDLGGGQGRISGVYTSSGYFDAEFTCAADGAIVTLLSY
jgi:hypothetical protein